jgi:hypothetical protein
LSNRSDSVIIQFIAASIISIAANWPQIRYFLSQFFPHADVAIPAGAFVMLYQILFFLYSKYLWRYHPALIYLGGQWVYRTSEAETTPKDSTQLCKQGNSFYGVFEIIHTPDKVSIPYGEVWYCGKPPDEKNRRSYWQSSSINYDGETLWLIGKVIGNDSRSEHKQILIATIARREGKLEMNGTVWGVADPDGKDAFGFTIIKKISNRSRRDAAQEAYRIFGSTSTS